MGSLHPPRSHSRASPLRLAVLGAGFLLLSGCTFAVCVQNESSPGVTVDDPGASPDAAATDVVLTCTIQGSGLPQSE